MFSAERTMAWWHGVVAGFDGTDQARCAVRWAAGEAVARNCSLHVVHVVEHAAHTATAGWLPVVTQPDKRQRDFLADQLLTEMEYCLSHHPGLEVHAAMHDGVPPTFLTEYADLVRADVLAVGVSDLGPVSRMVFGSTGAALIRTTTRPVVVVRDPTPVQQAATATGYAPVVALADDQATVSRVLATAADMANRWQAGITVVHDQAHVPVTVMRGQLRVLRRRCSMVPVTVESVAANPLRAVLARSTDARMVVVGERRPGVVERLLRGSVSRVVMRHAESSVAIVP